MPSPTAALERAHRVDGLCRMVLDGLSADEARELLGPALGGAELSALHGETGGNPFYMEQLARASDRAGNSAPAADGSLVRMGVPAGATATLVFNADGTVDVNPGCNHGRGSWTRDGTGIAFKDVVLTKMACADPAGSLENAVLAVLNQGAVQASIRANVLTLQAGGHGLQLTAT